MNRSCRYVFLIAIAACGGSGVAHVGLGGRAGSAASTAASAGAQAGQPLDLQNGIVITRLRVVLSEVKLESSSTSRAGEAELKSAPVLIDLLQSDLEAGTSQEVALANLAPGTYRELKLRVHKPALSDPGVEVDSGLFWMASNDASVIVDGTIDARPFTFTSGVDAEEDLQGTFTFADGNHYVTLNLDPTGWFGGAGAGRLDPAADRARIENNIRASLRAFQDDDHDGREDRR